MLLRGLRWLLLIALVGCARTPESWWYPFIGSLFSDYYTTGPFAFHEQHARGQSRLARHPGHQSGAVAYELCDDARPTASGCCLVARESRVAGQVSPRRGPAAQPVRNAVEPRAGSGGPGLRPYQSPRFEAGARRWPSAGGRRDALSRTGHRRLDRRVTQPARARARPRPHRCPVVWLGAMPQRRPAGPSTCSATAPSTLSCSNSLVK